MAGKARRAASRQGQLKRKKQAKGPSGIPSNTGRVTVPEANGTTDGPTSTHAASLSPETIVSEAEETTYVPRSALGRTPRGESASQGHGRLRGERPAAYLYVGAEFRRILTLTSAVIAALIVLGIVL